MEKVRNPLAGLALTLLGSFGLCMVVAIPALFIPYFELRIFYLALVVFGVGILAARASFLGSLGFAGSITGGFAGLWLFQTLFWPNSWQFLLALGLGALCGLGGMVTGKLGLRKVERMAEELPKSRRCQRCGVRVGVAARKCWSCRAYLPPT